MNPLVDTKLFGETLSVALRYAEILANEGIKWGLIGPREGDRIWERHVLNSLALGALLSVNSTVIDVGTGAGLPGIPLAIARPDLEVTLLDSLERRVEFLHLAVEELGLPNVTIARSRAEDFPKASDYCGPFDFVTCRAVAPLPKLLKWCLPLLTSCGELIAQKGEQAFAEVDAATPLIKKLRLTVDVKELRLTSTSEKTWAIVVKK